MRKYLHDGMDRMDCFYGSSGLVIKAAADSLGRRRTVPIYLYIYYSFFIVPSLRAL